MIWVWGVLLTLLTLVLAIVARRLHSTRERFSQVESRLAGVLEMSDAGLAVWNQQGRLVACNKRFREFYQTIELKSGLVYEDLTRFTATRGLIQLAEDNVETWVQDRLTGFGDPKARILFALSDEPTVNSKGSVMLPVEESLTKLITSSSGV